MSDRLSERCSVMRDLISVETAGQTNERQEQRDDEHAAKSDSMMARTNYPGHHHAGHLSMRVRVAVTQSARALLRLETSFLEAKQTSLPERISKMRICYVDSY